jgi:hypothetical protein
MCAIIGGAYAYFNRSPMLKLFGGVKNMEIVRHPTRVEAYRLGDPPSGSPPTDEASVSPLDYPVTAGPVLVSNKTAAAVSTSLMSRETYGWDYAKACGEPIYGVKLSFFQGNDRVDVYFCFLCNVLAVACDGQTFGGEDFDDARAVFVQAAKQAFPDDPIIQKLVE